MAVRRSIAALCVALCAAVMAPSVHAGGGPQNVVVITNPDDPDSLAVANAYVELRNIPPTNVIYIPWTLDVRAATGPQFVARMLRPVLAELKRRGIASQIDCMALSSGFPYLVDCAPLFPGQTFPREARPTTSLTSAAYLYQFLLNNRPEMFAMNANLYFAPTVAGRTTSRSFSAARKWGAGGVADPANGMVYMLATALGVTHGQGNKAVEIIDCLKRAKEADGKKYRGTIYYMQNKDIRSSKRHDTFPAAVAELAQVGVKAVIAPGAVPTNKPDVAGLTTGAQHVNLRTSGSKLLPGALVDNLTSAGGQMLIRVEPNPQTRISEYIRLGAAGASGTVVEPFAIPEKFPSAALHVHYARGCSLAESFYQSISAPAHQLIIGDPLCHPWAVEPQVAVAGLPEGGVLSGDVSLTPTAKYADARAASRFELFINGIRTQAIDPGKSFALKTGDLADGFHELRVVAIDDTPIAVQGAWIQEAQVKNGRNAVQLKVTPVRVPLSGTIDVEAASTVKGDVIVRHNGRTLGTVAGGSGRVQIPAQKLGRGRVKLEGEQAGAPAVRSRPMVVEIY